MSVAFSCAAHFGSDHRAKSQKGITGGPPVNRVVRTNLHYWFDHC
jgi:hypothetical protein